MTAQDGGSPRMFRTLLGAALAALLAALVMTAEAAPAAASSSRTVTLGLSNVRVDIDAGDAVTFVPVGGAYKIVSTVTGTIRYSNPGTYTVSWTVQKVTSILGPLGQTVTKLTQVASCTATVVVAPVVTKVTSAASKVVSRATKAVQKVVPSVHVRVSVPRVLPNPTGNSSHRGAPAPTSSAAAAPGAGGSSSGSGRAGGLTATDGGTSAGSAGAGQGAVVGGVGAPTAGSGAGGGYVVDVPGGSGVQPVSMNQAGTGSGQPATAAKQGNAEEASAFGSARFPVLLAFLAIVALVGVTIGYTRYYVFGRMS